MTISIGADTGKHYAGYGVAFNKHIVACNLVKAQRFPNTHGPEYRQGKFPQPDCDSARLIGHAIGSHIKVLTTAMSPVELIAEVPTSKDIRAKKLKSDALMFLAITAGAISASIPDLSWGVRTRFIEPSEWKHQVPEDAMWLRIDEALTEQERKIAGIDALKKRFGAEFHHVLEGVGVLLWSMWRLQ